MVVSDELINSLFFHTQLSSGNDVVIYHNRLTDEIKSSLVSPTGDPYFNEVIFTYNPSLHHHMSEDEIKTQIRDVISGFISELREQKIDSILKKIK